MLLHKYEELQNEKKYQVVNICKNSLPQLSSSLVLIFHFEKIMIRNVLEFNGFQARTGFKSKNNPS